MASANTYLQRFITRRRSQIYAGLTLLSPLVALKARSLELFWPVFIGIVGVVVFSLLFPKYVKLMFTVEDAINLKLAKVTPSRLVRILFQLPLVWGVCAFVASSGQGSNIQMGTLILLVAAANGLQALGITMAYCGIGDRMSNSLGAFAATAGLSAFSLVSPTVLFASVVPAILFALYLLLGLLSDFRSVIYPKKGVGVFFGTFNPIHKTHLQILRDAIEQRGLKKIYLHPTTVPKLHRTALESGEISMTLQSGMRMYSTTALADPSKNYFPTGNMFYEYELRHELLKAGVNDAGLQDRVEILDWPEVYEGGGFMGILRRIKMQHASGTPIHGIHGSDPGGIWVRNIFDISGWVYPYPVVRSDGISATAIREGAIGCTSPTIEAFLAAARTGNNFVFPSGYVFTNNNLTNRNLK